MPLPQSVARLNKRFTNRLIEPIVRRFAGYAVIEHYGRQSGAIFRTPVYIFRCDGSLIVALTYGARSDWVQNVLANSGVVHQDGTERPISSATIVGRAAIWHCLPRFVRLALRVLNVDEFLSVD